MSSRQITPDSPCPDSSHNSDENMNHSDEQNRGRRVTSSSYNTSSNDSMRGSTLSQEERKNKILKFWDKKIAINNKKKHVRYHCRKDLADNRFRYHGRFISKDQMQKIVDSSKQGFEDIYDPKMKCTPKTKQIFKIDKHQRNCSSNNSNCRILSAKQIN